MRMPRGAARQAVAISAAVCRPAATWVNRSSSTAARRASVRWKALAVSKNRAGDGPGGGIVCPSSTYRGRDPFPPPAVILGGLPRRAADRLSRPSAPDAAEPVPGGDPERELLAQRVVGDARVLAERLVDVLRSDSIALLLVELERLRIDRDGELLFVGGSDDPVALDAAAQEQGRPDRPVVLAVARVVGRGPAHLALDDDHELLADLQIPGPADEVRDPGQELGDELHLVRVVVGVAVELPDGEVGRHAHASLEGRERDLRLLLQTPLRARLGNVLRHALQGLRVDLRGVEHVVGPRGPGQPGVGPAGGVLLP